MRRPSGRERAPRLHELADGIVRPVQREAVHDEVVRALLEVEDLGVGATARAAGGPGRGQHRGPEPGARADDGRRAKAPVNLSQPFCDLVGHRLVQEVRAADAARRAPGGGRAGRGRRGRAGGQSAWLASPYPPT